MHGDAALITGASSGLGRELAIQFSQSTYPHSNHVILSGRNERELQKTRDLCAGPHNTTLVCGDLRDSGTILRLASLAESYSIQYLICCAGVYYRGSVLNDTSYLIDINTKSTINLIRNVYPHLRPGTSIVHINSVAGKNISPDEAAYSASKHAVTGFLRSFRFEARQRGVRVLDVFPGAIQTPMTVDRANYPDLMPPFEVAQIIHTIVTLPLETAQIEELHLGRIIS